MRDFRLCPWCQQYTIAPDWEADKKEIRELNKVSYMGLSKEERVLFDKQMKKIESKQMKRKRVPTCDCCGEETEIKMMSDAEFIAYGHKLYQEFIIFMGDKGKTLPQKIDVRVNNNRGGAMCDYDEKLKMFYIEFNSHEQLHRHNIAPVFYHEFQHIYDMHDPITKTKRENAQDGLFLHEYLASAVQMKKMLRYKNVDEKKKISLSSKIIYDNKTMTLEDYIPYYLDKEAKRIKKDEKFSHLNFQHIFSIAYAILYYLGEISVLREYIDVDRFKSLSNINVFEKDLLSLVVCDDGEQIQSFKALEDYILNSADNLKENEMFRIIRDTSVWISKHIRNFKI